MAQLHDHTEGPRLMSPSIDADEMNEKPCQNQIFHSMLPVAIGRSQHFLHKSTQLIEIKQLV